MVRAKFICHSITRRKHWEPGKGEIWDIKLSPVTTGSDEDKAFWAATPSGEITLGTCNAEAVKQFDLGAAYYVDFTPAPRAEGK
ncbi:MAG TPA: hypothetical protein VD948_11240 [Rhodothermales bacterium]|nr:hypothetical protein [Rhodothermales bacterium]